MYKVDAFCSYQPTHTHAEKEDEKGEKIENELRGPVEVIVSTTKQFNTQHNISTANIRRIKDIAMNVPIVQAAFCRSKSKFCLSLSASIIAELIFISIIFLFKHI